MIGERLFLVVNPGLICALDFTYDWITCNGKIHMQRIIIDFKIEKGIWEGRINNMTYEDQKNTQEIDGNGFCFHLPVVTILAFGTFLLEAAKLLILFNKEFRKKCNKVQPGVPSLPRVKPAVVALPIF